MRMSTSARGWLYMYQLLRVGLQGQGRESKESVVSLPQSRRGRYCSDQFNQDICV